ncbi:hypothetical protein CD006_25300 [Enterobacter sp. 10-1]|uniref:hypothetical protein n=1 Tax=Raoultella sp. 10-1 TaxID=2683201 RepID=UPI000BA35F30|nr:MULTISPECIES: hypothetical protein [Enterobacteriaceae]MVT05888.1 hypothetical protein [Raoultella sp. 10-1]PAC07728.1 hypothetical protein CD006_25300 [Enterobacter sp. 10-1]
MDKIDLFVLAILVLVLTIVGGGIFNKYIMPPDHIATDDELLMISRETPCAAEEFLNALTPSDRSNSKPLTIRDARNLASECTERDEEINLHEKQLKTLNGINK